MICLLQLRDVSSSLGFPCPGPCPSLSRCDVLSAGEEPARLGHLVAVLALGADSPGHADDADEDEAHDGRVGLPVCGLRIPTTGRRPDVLGVSACGQRAGRRGIGGGRSRDLSSAAHCEVWLWRILGCCSCARLAAAVVVRVALVTAWRRRFPNSQKATMATPRRRPRARPPAAVLRRPPLRLPPRVVQLCVQ